MVTDGGWLEMTGGELMKIVYSEPEGYFPKEIREAFFGKDNEDEDDENGAMDNVPEKEKPEDDKRSC